MHKVFLLNRRVNEFDETLKERLHERTFVRTANPEPDVGDHAVAEFFLVVLFQTTKYLSEDIMLKFVS